MSAFTHFKAVELIIKPVQCVWFVLAKDSDALNNLDSVEAVIFKLGLT